MAHRPVVNIFSWVPGLAAKLRAKSPSFEVQEIKIPPRFTGKKNDIEEDSLHQLREAEVLLICPNAITSYDLLHELHQAKWVMSTWAGVDGIMKCVDRSKNVPKFTLTRFGGVFGAHMTEYVIGHMISHERYFAGIRAAQQQNRWATLDFCEYGLLSQLTLGIIGMGDIGNDVARAAKFFGMTVLGLGRRDNPPDDRTVHLDKYLPISRLDELLTESDYVCNILPSTEQTRGLFSGDTLKPCQNKKSVFMNIGRGDVIDEASIVRALDSGWIRHAILDVHNPEPLPETSALWQHPGVTITPHVSATSFADQVVDKFLENYEKYVKGERLDYLVDWEAGY